MFWQQFRLLLWKNYILRKRHWIRTLIEIIWPTLLFVILVGIRKSQEVDTKGECHYPGRAMPSAGVYPWLKSIVCDISNPCFSVEVPSEVPGQVNTPVNGSQLSSILETSTVLLQDAALVNNLTMLTMTLQTLSILGQDSVPLRQIVNEDNIGAFMTGNLSISNDTADALLQSNISLTQITALTTVFADNSTVCNATALGAVFTLDPSASPVTVAQLSSDLCALSDAERALLSTAFASNVNVTELVQLQLQTAALQSATSQLQAITPALQPLLASVGQLQQVNLSSQSSLLTLLFGSDISTSAGFSDFCGHPQHQNVPSLGSAIAAQSSSSLLNFNSSSSNNSNAFCQNLINTLENDTEYSFFWDTFKPLLLGKITYTPDTELTRAIVAEANKTFESIAFIGVFGDNWERTIGPAAYQLLENGATVNSLRTLLSLLIASDGGGLTGGNLGVTTQQLQQLNTLLSNADDPNDGVTTWKEIYAQINRFLLVLTRILSCIELDKFVAFPDEPQLVTASLALVESKTLWAGIVFDTGSTDATMPPIMKYRIRQDASSVTKTDRIQSFFWRPGQEEEPTRVKYYTTGFVHVQDIVERALVSVTHAQRNLTDRSTQGAYLQLMPYPCYTRDRFLEYLSNLLSLLMTLAWVYSVCIIVKNIVYEKEQRLKEVMKMMGLSNGVHWIAWFINAFALMFVSSLLLIMILRVGAVLPYSDLFIILMWLSCFAIATISQCFLISCFFSRANLAAACAGIIYFVLYIPYNMAYAFESQMTITTKIIACLLSSVAFGYGAGYVSKYEMAGEGIQFSNWQYSPDPQDELNFFITMMMMLVDAAIYLILMWYIENVFPGKYGVPRPWYFFLTSHYWCGTVATQRDAKTFSPDLQPHPEEDQIKLEQEPEHLPLGVSIFNLNKIYGNGKRALNNLSMNFYEGQITSFLGHNGAGKTTTMSILTGLFPASSGTASIYGKDIRSEMDQIRNQLGFCPQHNVLFGDLTVYEHLQLYGGLKAAVVGKKVDRAEAARMLDDVGLPHKRDEVSRHLSGGMKRKLSVAVAFIGGSKCVILDEPTAGVDPYARRGIWDLLLKFRANRTIVLSTHHMDEADLLGDRIAIISQGKLKCCGSSLFLKSCYGVGYYVTMVKSDLGKLIPVVEKTPIVSLLDADPGDLESSPAARDTGTPETATAKDEGFESNSQSSENSLSSSLKSLPAEQAADANGSTEPKVEKHHAGLRKLVTSFVPDARIHEESAREATFILPYSALTNGQYSKLFARLDEAGVAYGLTDTSLEEIFLSVAQQPDQDEEDKSDDKCCCCIPKRRRKKHKIQPARGGDRERTASYAGAITQRRLQTLSATSGNGKVNASYTPALGDDPDDDCDGFDVTRGAGSYKVKGRHLVLQQFKALFVKRFHNARRNRKGIVAQIIVPACFVALALIFALIVPKQTDYPPLELQPWMYGDTNTFYSADNDTDPVAVAIGESLISPPGIGMKCVDGYFPLNYDDELVVCDGIPAGAWTSDGSTRGLSVEQNDTTTTCACTDKLTRVLLAECPLGTAGEPSPMQRTQTGDQMYNMTGRNVSDWLVKTVDRFRQERYGALSLGERFHATVTEAQVVTIINWLQTFANITFNITGQELYETFVRVENSKVWFDNNGYHAMPTWLNVHTNAALRSALPADVDPAAYGVVAVNHPLNLTSENIDIAAFKDSATNTLVAISVVFALSFVPASFVLFLIEERISKAKHLQFISGVNQAVYWIANFMWDLLNYAVPAFIVVCIFLCFQTDAYVSADNLPCLISILLLYGFAVTPMMYPASFYFKIPSTAYVVLTCINLFIGINTSIATFILEALDDPNLNEVNEYLKKIFLVFPQYCLGRGLIDMAVNQAYADAYASFGIYSFKNPFEFDVVGRNLMSLGIEGVVFFILTLLMQYRFFVKRDALRGKSRVKLDAHAHEDDDDVIREKARIRKSGACDDILQIRDLSKVYRKRGTKKPLIAVDSMSVGVPKGECFGLLGVNGAGKTTTFKMLTGDTTPSHGDALVCGHSVLYSLREVQQNTGYCPQFEALSSMLTAREHLALYAKLRGVPVDDIPRVVEWGVRNFGLINYADKPAGTYSGGNKRKLSAAIAFIGCPPIVFLDEPTAGMDPLSRRFLWKRIAEAVKAGQCVVLTSHSMEECEALCTRLAIMVNGRFRCIGSALHLKNRYGKGYTFSLKVTGDDGHVKKVQAFIMTSFPQATLKEVHCNMLMYQLPLDDVKLSQLFEVLESNKSRLKIEDYSVSQTTLDEVFVSFAKLQTDGIDDADDNVSRKHSAPPTVDGVPAPSSSDDDSIVLRNLPTTVQVDLTHANSDHDV